jgi:3-dehydroquinate dehydratase-1
MNPVIVRNIAIGEGKPKICVPIVAQTREDILKEASEIRSLPIDVVEWRVDWYAECFGPGKTQAAADTDTVDIVIRTAEALRGILGEIPLLFTFRTSSEGGERPIAEKDYETLNCMAAASGYVDLVDLELFTVGERLSELAEMIHRNGIRIVASSHDFQKTPDQEELVRRMVLMQERGADIAKMAVMPQNRRDVLTLLGATVEMTEEHPSTPVITMSMSATGVTSRLTGESFGSALTFGAAKKASAPGQIGVEELKQVLDIIHRAV